MADPLTKFEWGVALDTTPPGVPERGIFTDDNSPTVSMWGNAPVLAALCEPSNYLLYKEHFDRGGYVRDLALANESDPAGGQFSEVADASEWLVTVTDGGGDNDNNIVISDTLAGGWAVCTTTDADNDKLHIQKNGTLITPTAGKDIWFETRIQIDDADKTDWFIGLQAVAVDALGALTNVIGFIVAAGDVALDIKAVSDKATVETQIDTGSDIADDTSIILGFHVIGVTRVDIYVNRVKLPLASSIPTANIPVVGLSPTIDIRNAGAQANAIRVDYIWLLAEL